MQYCQKCKINIRGNKTKCPLCQGRLSQSPENPAFPSIKKNTMTTLSIIKIATFCFLTLEIVMASVWFLAEHELKCPIPWAWLVMVGAVVVWVDLLLAIYLRNNVMKIITMEAYIAMIVDYGIDRMTGFLGWSVIWMIPATFIGLGLATALIGIIGKLKLENYIIYLLVDTVFCMFQIIPVLHGTNSFGWPAVICMALYLILAAGTIVFKFNELKNASAKYFNV